MVDWAGICGVASDDGNYDHEVHDPQGFTAGQSISASVQSKEKTVSDMRVDGVIEAYFVNTTKNGGFQHVIMVNGSKYSAFAKDDKPRANNGDTVEFPVTQKGQYWNITGPINVTKRATGHQQGNKQSYAPNEDKRQQSILRQSSMNYAATIVAAGANNSGLTVDEMAQEVIRIADEYFYPFASEGKKPE